MELLRLQVHLASATEGEQDAAEGIGPLTAMQAKHDATRMQLVAHLSSHAVRGLAGTGAARGGHGMALLRWLGVHG